MTSNNNIDIYPLQQYLKQVLEDFKNCNEGSLADYIPELAKANKDWFGIALATAEGHIYQVGDSRLPFTIQSISKPFTYGLALDLFGVEHVLQKVGVEPSGEAFNEISLEEGSGRPFNPMINAGAIATTALVDAETSDIRFEKIRKTYEKFVAHELKLDESVYHSESETGNRNRAIAYLLRNSSIIEDKTEETLDLYFKQCSILVNCRDLAVMGATLANNGVNPITGVVALKSENVERVLSIMSTCGMYDYAGGWIYHVGMPAKSGVAGGIMAVLPGQFGIGVFSPLLDKLGNSVRGIKVCQKISSDYGLHMFDSSKASNSVIRAKYDTTTISSKRLRTPEEFSILRNSGYKIKVYELAGDLIFSSIDFVIKTVISEFDNIEYIILDLKRVTSVKRSACNLLANLVRVAVQNNKHILFTNTDYQFTKLIRIYLENEQFRTATQFRENDFALEWCENSLIKQYIEPLRIDQKVPLKNQSLLSGMENGQLELLKNVMEKRTYSKGQTIISEGDFADSLFFITVGDVSVRVASEKNSDEKRIASLSAGTSFGEMTIVDRRERSASIVAESEVECYELKFSILDGDNILPAELKNRLMINIISDLSNKIRKLNQEIRVYQ